MIPLHTASASASASAARDGLHVQFVCYLCSQNPVACWGNYQCKDANMYRYLQVCTGIYRYAVGVHDGGGSM